LGDHPAHVAPKESAPSDGVIYPSWLTYKIYSMDCVRCPVDTRVLDTRPAGDAVRRRRECLVCGERFTTWERVDLDADEVERAVVAYVRGLDPTTEEISA
jgi:hypothetical protein